MSSEEEIKRKIIERQQETMNSQVMQQVMQQQQQLEMLKMLMTEILEPKARERISNLKLVKPELATQVQIYLVQAYQAGQIRGKLSDEDLVAILKKVDSKKDFKITRK